VYTLCQTFLCYLHSILKKHLSLVLSFCFSVVFALLLLHLSAYFVFLLLIPHPTVAIRKSPLDNTLCQLNTGNTLTSCSFNKPLIFSSHLCYISNAVSSLEMNMSQKYNFTHPEFIINFTFTQSRVQ